MRTFFQKLFGVLGGLLFVALTLAVTGVLIYFWYVSIVVGVCALAIFLVMAILSAPFSKDSD